MAKTKELKKRSWGRRRRRIITSGFGKSRLARAALPFSRSPEWPFAVRMGSITEPHDSPNEPHASPLSGFPIRAFNRGSPIEPSIETLSRGHTREPQCARVRKGFHSVSHSPTVRPLADGAGMGRVVQAARLRGHDAVGTIRAAPLRATRARPVAVRLTRQRGCRRLRRRGSRRSRPGDCAAAAAAARACDARGGAVVTRVVASSGRGAAAVGAWASSAHSGVRAHGRRRVRASTGRVDRQVIKMSSSHTACVSFCSPVVRGYGQD